MSRRNEKLFPHTANQPLSRPTLHPLDKRQSFWVREYKLQTSTRIIASLLKLKLTVVTSKENRHHYRKVQLTKNISLLFIELLYKIEMKMINIQYVISFGITPTKDAYLSKGVYTCSLFKVAEKLNRKVSNHGRAK